MNQSTMTGIVIEPIYKMKKNDDDDDDVDDDDDDKY